MREERGRSKKQGLRVYHHISLYSVQTSQDKTDRTEDKTGRDREEREREEGKGEEAALTFYAREFLYLGLSLLEELGDVLREDLDRSLVVIHVIVQAELRQQVLLVRRCQLAH